MHDVCKFSINIVFLYITAFKLQDDKTGAETKRYWWRVATNPFCGKEEKRLSVLIQPSTILNLYLWRPVSRDPRGSSILIFRSSSYTLLFNIIYNDNV